MERLETEELYYLPFEQQTDLEKGVWDSVEGCFLPSHVLNLAYLLRSLALLSWTTEEEVSKYFTEKTKEMKKDMDDNKRRDQWRGDVYFSRKKEDLIKLCKERNFWQKKHELVERISRSEGENPPKPVKPYMGEDLPKTTKKLGKLQLSYLKSVLHWHGLPTIENKDRILLNVSLLANDRKCLLFSTRA